MIKESILQQLSHAQNSHLIWIQKANKLISNSTNTTDSIPFDSTECGLGIWISREGKQLRQISTLNKLIEKIEIHHNKLHNIYLNIYQIFFMIPQQKSFLQKLFNLDSKRENEEVKEAATLHFQDIEQSSKELTYLLIELEKRIKALRWENIEINTKHSPLQRAV
jgi:hypothetical protein